MRIEIPEKKKFVYEMVFPVRWGDMDVMGHVNNTVYLRWMETIRIEWCRTVNAAPNPQGQGIVIANVFATSTGSLNTRTMCACACSSATRGAAASRPG